MALQSVFCSSPWIHMRVLPNGQFQYCRWQHGDSLNLLDNISTVDPAQFFQQSMSAIRLKMLQGERIDSCKDCVEMEANGKVSGRQKQLLKTGVVVDNFVKTTQSSPYFKKFQESQHTGETDLLPVDWQIDLGNFCNSACVFCAPSNSSRLAQEFVKLELISQVPPAPWIDNPQLVDKMINLLIRTPNLMYLHFIGGETLITPAFKQILSALVDQGMVNITIGFTTNLTVWDDEINSLLAKFKQVNLGMSVESLTQVNDYVRWPSKISQVKQCLDRWVDFAKERNWLISLRTTPTCLSIADLYTVYDYAWENSIGIESCNFLWKPEFLRISVLPQEIRNSIADHLTEWLADHKTDRQSLLINVRNPTRVRDYIVQDLASYVRYLRNTPTDTDQLPKLVAYLKKLESNRRNSVLEYVPQYEKLLRSAGY